MTIPGVRIFKAGDTNQKANITNSAYITSNYFADKITELKHTCIKRIDILTRKDHCRKVQDEQFFFYFRQPKHFMYTKTM